RRDPQILVGYGHVDRTDPAVAVDVGIEVILRARRLRALQALDGLEVGLVDLAIAVDVAGQVEAEQVITAGLPVRLDVDGVRRRLGLAMGEELERTQNGTRTLTAGHAEVRKVGIVD